MTKEKPQATAGGEASLPSEKPFRTNAGALKEWLDEEDLTPREAGEILQVSAQAVHGWRRQDKMPCWVKAFIAQRRRSHIVSGTTVSSNSTAILTIEGNAKKIKGLEVFLRGYPTFTVLGPFYKGENQ